MKIKLSTHDEWTETEKNFSKVKDILEEKDLNPVTHVVTINGEPAVEDKELDSEDKIKIYSVTSSG